jgi:uncharacterized membrane protein YbhN (UPF0104 family)
MSSATVAERPGTECVARSAVVGGPLAPPIGKSVALPIARPIAGPVVGPVTATAAAAALGRRRPRWPRAGRLLLRAVGVALVVATGTILVVDLRHTDLRATFADIAWPFVALAVGARALSFVAAAYNLSGFTPIRPKLVPTLQAQLAIGAVGVVTPAAMTTPAVGARFLARSGASTSDALASVGVAQAVQLVTTLAVVTAGGVVSGRTVLPFAGSWAALLIAAAVVAAVGAGWLLARRYSRVAALVRPAQGSLRSVVRTVRARPGRAVAGCAGSLALTGTHIAAFAFCVRAAGGHAPLITLLTIYLASAAAGSLIPTPGGAGPVEAAMIAGLTVAGVPLGAATAATVLSRLSIWVFVPAGWLALVRLRRRGLL